MPDFTTKQREKLAEEDEAMPDGSYPIRNVADLKRAIQAFGRSKNPEKTKAWIKKRARELDAEDLLPESWDDEAEHFDDDSDFLVHYGVLGMKWGVRKARKKGTSYSYTSRNTKYFKKKADQFSSKAKTTGSKKFEKYAKASKEAYKRSKKSDKKYLDYAKKAKVGKTIATNILFNTGARSYQLAKANSDRFTDKEAFWQGLKNSLQYFPVSAIDTQTHINFDYSYKNKKNTKKTKKPKK